MTQPIGRARPAMVLMMLIVACTPSSAKPPQRPERGGSMDAAAVLASARIDIEAGNAAWLRGMKQRDAAAVADAYADSGVFVGPDGQCVRGREAIMKMYELRVAKIATVLGGGVTSEATHVVGDRVYEWGHAWLELAGPRPADPAIKRGGPYLTVWQRDATAAGHWRIIRNLAL